MARNDHSKCARVRRLLGWCALVVALMAHSALADILSHCDDGTVPVYGVVENFWEWYNDNGFKWWKDGNDPYDVVGFTENIPNYYADSPPLNFTFDKWALWSVVSNETFSVQDAINYVEDYTNRYNLGALGFPQYDGNELEKQFQMYTSGELSGLYWVVNEYEITRNPSTIVLLNEVKEWLRYSQNQSALYVVDGEINNAQYWMDVVKHGESNYFYQALKPWMDATDVGWQFVRTNGGGDPFSFGIDYSINSPGQTSPEGSETLHVAARPNFDIINREGIYFLDHGPVMRAQGIEGDKYYSWQKYPFTAYYGGMRTKKQNASGNTKIESYSWGGCAAKPITITFVTYRRVAYLWLKTLTLGDWGYYCYPSETYWNEESDEVTTMPMLYTEVYFEIEEPEQDNEWVSASYVHNQKISVVASKTNQPNSFSGGPGSVGFLQRPERGRPEFFK